MTLVENYAMFVEISIRRILHHPLFTAERHADGAKICSRRMFVIPEITLVFLTKSTRRIFIGIRRRFGEFRYIFIVFFGLTEIYRYFKNVIFIFISPSEVSGYSGFLDVIIHNAYTVKVIARLLSS